jgi:hypothetical protein
MYNQPPPGARYATEEEKQQALATLQQSITNVRLDDIFY